MRSSSTATPFVCPSRLAPPPLCLTHNFTAGCHTPYQRAAGISTTSPSPTAVPTATSYGHARSSSCSRMSSGLWPGPPSIRAEGWIGLALRGGGHDLHPGNRRRHLSAARRGRRVYLRACTLAASPVQKKEEGGPRTHCAAGYTAARGSKRPYLKILQNHAMPLLELHFLTWPENQLLRACVLGKELMKLAEGDPLVRIHVNSFEYAFEHIAAFQVSALHVVRNAELLLRERLD